MYPMQSIEHKIKSRLAWCYGDLGIAIALWQAGKRVNNISWRNKAIDIALFSTTRLTAEETNIQDAEVCHGSAGVASIFGYFFNETEDERFMEAMNYWILATMQMAQFPDGLAGYKCIILENGKLNFEDSFEFLTGISGIGMVLLTYLGGWNLKSKWTEILLLH